MHQLQEFRLPSLPVPPRKAFLPLLSPLLSYPPKGPFNCDTLRKLTTTFQVQSHDAGSFKDQGFSYNLETSRQFQARGAAASTYGSNIAGPSTMTTPYPDGIPSHPAASASGTNGNANTPAPAHHMEGMPYRNGSAYTYGPASAPRTGFVWNGLPASESTSGYPNPAAPEGQAGYQAGGSGSTSNGGTSAYGANGAYTHQGPYASSVPYAVHEPRYPFTAYHAAYHAYTGQLPPLPSTRATAMGVNGLENPSSYGYSNHLTAAVPSPHRAQNPSSEDIKPPVSSASTSSSVTLAGGAALSDRESHGSQTTIPVHQMHRNNSVSSMGSYGNRRSTASPATSLSTSHQEGTPSSSFDSYTTSPATTATGYPPAASSQRQSSSSGSNGMYTTSPAGSSNADFPPSSHGYVYTDTTAAAILAAAAHRRATPGNERNGNGTGSSNTYEASHSALAAGSYAMPAELSGDQRKAAMGP